MLLWSLGVGARPVETLKDAVRSQLMLMLMNIIALVSSLLAQSMDFCVSPRKSRTIPYCTSCVLAMMMSPRQYKQRQFRMFAPELQRAGGCLYSCCRRTTKAAVQSAQQVWKKTNAAVNPVFDSHSQQEPQQQEQQEQEQEQISRGASQSRPQQPSEISTRSSTAIPYGF